MKSKRRTFNDMRFKAQGHQEFSLWFYEVYIKTYGDPPDYHDENICLILPVLKLGRPNPSALDFSAFPAGPSVIEKHFNYRCFGFCRWMYLYWYHYEE